MNQYTPMPQVTEDPLLSRKVTKREYEKVIDYALELGMEDGFIQEGEAAKESFIPEFNLEGDWDLIQEGCGYPNRNKAWKGVPVQVPSAGQF